MTRRLTSAFLGLLAVLLVLVGVPLATGYAQTQTQALLLDRTGDASRLARLAAPAFARDEISTLEPEVRSYAELYGIRVEVRDRDGTVLLVADGGAQVTAAEGGLARALAGQRSASSPPVRPWAPSAITVAEPVLRGTDVAGAVVTVSPTDRVRRDILVAWVLLAVGGFAALAGAAVMVVPLSRWILRPVRRLDEAVHTLAEGDLSARADPGQGPPELRRLIAAFNAMAEALRTSSAQQRALVADASHQLRNPLTALRLRVDALETVVVPEGAGDHRLAVEEIERLTRVLDDTLALARAQDGGDEPIAADLLACVRERLATWSDVAAQGDTVVLLEAEDSGWVLAPPGALERVLDALLHNSLRFARGGTVVVHVTRPGPDAVELLLIDDGPGLTLEQCRAASQRFWRGPDQQNIPGSGLGLAIASTLVERCGGHLDLMPAHPHGLQVRVVLPCVQAVPAAPAQPVAPGLTSR
ncbi:MAG: HAMP domain-containing histidine kinase [Frankiales bacterium]|nr:HAMP domain-containing histidine kinase [Frankiales bacterium]